MNNNTQEKNHLVLKKAKVPLRACLKISFKNLWKKKFRYLTMFIICSLSLAFLSITIELNGDKLRQNIYTMVENGYNYTEIFKSVPASKKDIKLNYYNKYNSTALDPNSYSTIKKELPNLIVHQYAPININYAGQNIENRNYFFTGVIDNLIKFDKTNTYNLVCGRLPREDKKEILITDFLYEAFKYFGLYPNLDSITDIINQRINLKNEKNYTIVGVIKTNYEKWSHFSTIEHVTTHDKENYSYNNDFTVMNSIVIPEKYFNAELSVPVSNVNFSNYENVKSLGKWKISTEANKDFPGIDSSFVATSNPVNISSIDWNNNPQNPNLEFLGQQVKNDDEIVIPYKWINGLFSTDQNKIDWVNTNDNRWHGNLWQMYCWFLEYIQNKEITLTLSNSFGKTYTKTYKVVGITYSNGYVNYSEAPKCQLTSDEIIRINDTLKDPNEKIIVQLPESSRLAYKQFNQAFKKGYVLNVWAYKQDIDNYVVDPFINLSSKAGLFIFAAFTIAIMWTIITIEIVDSQKEIGILRSIGLSGAKVSFIFIFQAAFVCFFSYIAGNLLSWYLIPIYNSGIMDELNKITLYMYSYTYRSPIILAVFVIVMTFISTVIPLCKIMFKKIIDVINEREN